MRYLNWYHARESMEHKTTSSFRFIKCFEATTPVRNVCNETPFDGRMCANASARAPSRLLGNANPLPLWNFEIHLCGVCVSSVDRYLYISFHKTPDKCVCVRAGARVLKSSSNAWLKMFSEYFVELELETLYNIMKLLFLHLTLWLGFIPVALWFTPEARLWG